MKILLNRLKNPGTIAALVSFVVIILINFGIKVNVTVLTNVVNAVCGIGLLLGVMNNPDGATAVKVTTDLAEAIEGAEDSEATNPITETVATTEENK
jgi:uncharacterized membrane protein